jgi:glutamate synthase domain-containing protein 2
MNIEHQDASDHSAMEPERQSATFPVEVIHRIQTMSKTGRYEIRGWGAKRRVPNFDDLTFVTASASRYPLEGYREQCDTKTVLGTRFASKRYEFRQPVRTRKGRARPCRNDRRHFNDDR